MYSIEKPVRTRSEHNFERMHKMRIAAQKTIVVAIVALFCITLIPACQEEAIQESPSDARRVRTLIFEKSKLEEQIVDLKASHANELEEQKQLLDECEKENVILRTDVSENTEQLLNQMLTPLLKEADDLRKENAALKEQIKQLKGN